MRGLGISGTKGPGHRPRVGWEVKLMASGSCTRELRASEFRAPGFRLGAGDFRPACSGLH